jgi:hypothetical protein
MYFIVIVCVRTTSAERSLNILLNTPNTPIHEWFGTGISIESGGDKLCLWTQMFMLCEMTRP